MRKAPYLTRSSLLIKLEKFLQNQRKGRGALLVGFSGGEDSLALVHALHALKEKCTLAHFDHAWREGSDREAEQLAQFAAERNLPFICQRSQQGNRGECAAREERIAFFDSLFKNGEFAALVLAHHQRDQAETILKRVLEGAHLSSLKAMRPVAHWGSLPIWRPFLQVTKAEIQRYCEENQLQPIEDQTNVDPKYLRARLRLSVLPSLTQSFGKNVETALFQLGEYGEELHQYLRSATMKFGHPVKGPMGLMWDLRPHVHAPKIELRFALRHLFSKAPSRPVFDRAIAALSLLKPNEQISLGKGLLVIDRGILFFLDKGVPRFPKEIPLQEGRIASAGWEWEIHQTIIEREKRGWKNWWKGEVGILLPEGSYTLSCQYGDVKKEWNEQKVPAFLRCSLPTIKKDGNVIANFFTGETKKVQHGVIVRLISRN